MKRAKMLILLTATTLLFGILELKSQTFKNHDSTNTGFGIYELRDISKYLTEVQYRREQTNLLRDKVNSLERIILNKDLQIIGRDKLIDNYKKEIELLQPTFWDEYKFYFGLILGGLIITSIVVLVN